MESTLSGGGQDGHADCSYFCQPKEKFKILPLHQLQCQK